MSTKTKITKFVRSLDEGKTPTLKVLSNQPCRYIDIIIEKERTHLHHDLMMEYIKKGIDSPPGGCSGPLMVDFSVVPGYS